MKRRLALLAALALGVGGTAIVSGMAAQPAAQPSAAPAAAAPAAAATSDRSGIAAKIKAILDERAQSRPRLSPPPIGRPVIREAIPDVNWQEVRGALESSRAAVLATRATQTRVAGGSSVIGIFAVNPDGLKLVRRDEVNIAQLPILVPVRPDMADSLQLFSQPDAYTAIATIDGDIAMRISGARKRLVLDRPSSVRDGLRRLRDSRPALPGVDARYVITRSDSSTDLSFARFGVGYVVSIICPEPDTDARCTEDNFITTLTSSMALLNESAGEGR